ncbi:hypothetical protein BH11PSE11_BH11PSE11_01610 [soil metagenome]
MNARTRPLLLALLALSQAANAEVSEPAATPYRPSVSAPAAMSEPGWLDMEFGWQRSKGGGDRIRESFPVAAKLAFNKDWGVVLNSELGVRRTDFSDAVFTGMGDVTLLLKHRMPTASEDAAWGIMAGAKLPVAKDSIGSGKTDLILNGIYSTDFSGNNHLDANLGVTRLGAYSPGESRNQYGWAAAFAHNLNEQWSVFVEPSGTYRRGASSTAQIMSGASYSYSKRAVFDFAVARGLAAAAPAWQVQAGVTVLLGRLW